jgi:hypothetical protein
MLMIAYLPAAHTGQSREQTIPAIFSSAGSFPCVFTLRKVFAVRL